MTVRRSTLLCWFLAISHIFLPFAVSADDVVSSKAEHHCHEVNSATVAQVAVSDRHAGESVTLKDCCDHCDDGSACMGMASCGYSISQMTFIIAISPHHSQFTGFTQLSISQIFQYQSHIISPDIRPPVV